MTDRQYSAKEWLNEAYRIKETELKIKTEIAEKLKPDDGAIDYSKDKIQNDSSKLMEERLLSYTMAVQDIEETEAKIERVNRTRIAAINKLKSSEDRAMLIRRYIHQYEWKSICRELGYSRMELYRRHMKALDEIFDYIKEVEE